jgi:hypothetical protein
MAKPQYVKIEKNGVEGQCLPQSLDVWERNGWTVVDDGDSEDAGSEPEVQGYNLALPTTPPKGDTKDEE